MFQNILDEELLDFNNRLDSDISRLLRSDRIKIAVAESVTGGAIASRLVSRPGSSQYFLGGVVAYDTGTKVKLTGVQPKTIRDHGVVSEEVAKEMVVGVQRLLGSEVALSTTGIAGPPTDEFGVKDVGKVFIGLAIKEKVRVKLFQFKGTRDVIIQDIVQTALTLVRDQLKQKERSLTNGI
ncbi:CinA family protein [bacterium]|jgi:PncC family amidohydrolase|nr:CinA family protein [bacterium]